MTWTANTYMDSVAAERALLLDQDDATSGLVLISAETCDDLSDASILLFIQNNFGPFLQILRLLPPKERDLLTSYYLLRKPQHHLAAVFGLTQTIVSFQLRLAVRALAAIILFGGNPSAAQMRPILERAGLDTHTYTLHKHETISKNDICGYKEMRLSDLLAEYITARSFAAVARRHGLHRPDVRRTFKNISVALMASTVHEQRALGSYIELLIYKQSPAERGYTKCGKKALNDVVRSDSNILGEFRVNVEDPDFDELFHARANIG